MIFRNSALEALWSRSEDIALSNEITTRLILILDMLETAEFPEDLAIPGFGFHAFAVGSQPRFGVWASQRHRVSFAWNDREAVDVDLEFVP